MLKIKKSKESNSAKLEKSNMNAKRWEKFKQIFSAIFVTCFSVLFISVFIYSLFPKERKLNIPLSLYENTTKNTFMEHRNRILDSDKFMILHSKINAVNVSLSSNNLLLNDFSLHVKDNKVFFSSEGELVSFSSIKKDDGQYEDTKKILPVEIYAIMQLKLPATMIITPSFQFTGIKLDSKVLDADSEDYKTITNLFSIHYQQAFQYTLPGIATFSQKRYSLDGKQTISVSDFPVPSINTTFDVEDDPSDEDRRNRYR